MKFSGVSLALLITVVSFSARGEIFLCQSSVFSKIDTSGSHESGTMSVAWIIDTGKGWRLLKSEDYTGRCTLEDKQVWHCDNSSAEDVKFENSTGYSIITNNPEVIERLSLNTSNMGFTYVEDYYGNKSTSFSGICSEVK